MKTVENITPELKDSLTGKKSKTGRGGIQSKIRAAEIATKSGIPVVIANSRRENVIPDILSGIEVGTYFKPEGKMSAVKSWIAYSASVKGKIFHKRGRQEGNSRWVKSSRSGNNKGDWSVQRRRRRGHRRSE